MAERREAAGVAVGKAEFGIDTLNSNPKPAGLDHSVEATLSPHDTRGTAPSRTEQGMCPKLQ